MTNNIIEGINEHGAQFLEEEEEYVSVESVEYFAPSQLCGQCTYISTSEIDLAAHIDIVHIWPNQTLNQTATIGLMELKAML